VVTLPPWRPLRWSSSMMLRMKFDGADGGSSGLDGFRDFDMGDSAIAMVSF
jgi:hypothetical protein